MLYKYELIDPLWTKNDEHYILEADLNNVKETM